MGPDDIKRQTLPPGQSGRPADPSAQARQTAAGPRERRIAQAEPGDEGWDGGERRSGTERRRSRFRPDPATKPWSDTYEPDKPATGHAGPSAREKDLGEALEASVKENNDLRDRWMRAAADLDNQRKRVARDIEMALRGERETILRAFLAVLDNLDRALSAPEGDAKNLREGVEATRHQMLDALRACGAIPIDAEGAAFDPHLHEALGAVASPGVPEGAIVQVVQQGFCRPDGTLLRAATVLVARR